MPELPVPALSRGFIDRDENARLHPTRVAELRESAQARYLLVSGQAVAAAGEAGPVFYSVSELRARGYNLEDAYYLGTVAAQESTVPAANTTPAFFALDLTDSFATGVNRERPRRTVDGVEWCALISYGGLWQDSDVALATEAVALCAAWRQQRFCEMCGRPLRILESGWLAVCPDSHPTYPRTDAAVIMAVLDAQDRILLAHNARWEGNRHSVLAGFVEAGEPLESAVRREVAEEVGIEVTGVRYFGSQPWPFPRSLMVAFFARTEQSTADIRVDDREIKSAGFYSREALLDAARAGRISLPGRTSIAALMISQWLVGENTEFPGGSTRMSSGGAGFSRYGAGSAGNDAAAGTGAGGTGSGLTLPYAELFGW
ncbi:NAD+ diphosphatase [Actinobaculum suis]|uniref:NAD(+) diphosphatase n=1 Tax=Actinobaculum suis TaxID=1657 RepID=A0A1G7DJ93_9ACTO|nr:NAD(+) diphosphatase [Actinobaculum suis]MDY5154068.1 NAD(+) diphosphatase [Actinobaculum suis]SDE51136.1 NAD+ diphosphatase [Actinobaculum suis]